MNEATLWNRLYLSADMQAARETLQKSRLLLIGAGGLGSEIALKLAGCHIGSLTQIDRDTVSVENIPHSSIFLPEHVGQKKVTVVSTFLTAKFTRMTVTPMATVIQQCDPTLVAEYDFIVCAPDNDLARLYTNKLAVAHHKPALFVGLGGPRAEWTGYLFLYTPGRSGCFACFFSTGSEGLVPPLSSETERSEEDQQRCQPEEVAVPVLAPVASHVASFAAAVVLKSLLGMVSPTYTYLDLKQPRLHTMPVKQHPSCFVCGNPQEYELPYDES